MNTSEYFPKQSKKKKPEEKKSGVEFEVEFKINDEGGGKVEEVAEGEAGSEEEDEKEEEAVEN